MKIIRWIVGKILIILDWVTSPKKGYRSEENKQLVQEKLRNYVLYEFAACPFCLKVKRRMKALNLDIELRDAKNNSEYKKQLVEGGGKHKVPCLRIESQEGIKWMYESSDINEFLEKNFPLPKES